MADVKINGNNIGSGAPGSHVGDQKGIGTEHSSKDKSNSSEHAHHAGNGKDSRTADNRLDKQFARQSELDDQGRHTRAKIEAQVSKDAKHDISASLTRDAKEAKDSNGNRVARESDTRTLEHQSEQPRSRDNTSEKFTHTQHSSLDQHDKHSATPRAEHHERNDASSIVDYLRGAKDGSDLTPDMRKALDGAARATGRNDVAAFVEKHGENAATFIHRTLDRAGDASGSPTSHQELAGRAAVQQTIGELASVVGLGKHFKELEKTGGDIGRRAEDAAMRLLFHESGNHNLRGVSATEIMRDLRTGAFLPAREIDNPFPLTGRARAASEAMELMRTLDAVENALRQFESRRNPAAQSGGLEAGALHTAVGQISTGDPDLDALLTLIAKNTNGEELPGDLPLLMAALPGRAGQLETARFIAGLNGALTDANEGNLLRAADGSPLKLGELLWLGVADNLLAASFKADNFPTRLSPLLMHGFDALYSVIGFDGRTLAPPRFVAVEVQVNASELDWVYGQPPLSEGWMRAMIERLKDSIAPDHNVLGETLEEALAGGRFDTVLIQGAVEAGTPVAESFKVAAHAPATSLKSPLIASLAYS